MSMNSLPNEIALASVTMPILYRKLRYCDGQELDALMVPLLLRSLLRDRALVEYVQVLEISPGSCDGNIWFTDKGKVLIQKAVEEILEIDFVDDEHYIYTPNIQTWRDDVCKGGWDAIIAIILFLCPGLRKLHCVKWKDAKKDEEEENYVEWFMEIVSRSQEQAIIMGFKDLGALAEALKHTDLKHRIPLLPHLQHGKFELTPEYGQPDDEGTVGFLHFMQPPSFETFYIRGIVQDFQFKSDMRLGLKKLVMEQCVCDTTTIASVLQTCSHLEDFSYEHGNEGVHFGAVDPLFLMKGLLGLTGSLRKLRLARAQEEFWDCIQAEYSRLGSFASFQVLTHLSVPIDQQDYDDPLTMGLWKLVPRSLEYLFIDGTEENVLFTFAQQDLQQLVLKKWSFAPKLRHIVLGNISPGGAISGSALTPLKEACTVNGVRLTTQTYTLETP
ncbi:hypothetical protein VE02_01396 [Pseudogymnoascus sp. 03VT05]|nr:hypothetical protein VE02_01396 [Pseudogymnoascus sp. 03VT05]